MNRHYSKFHDVNFRLCTTSLRGSLYTWEFTQVFWRLETCTMQAKEKKKAQLSCLRLLISTIMFRWTSQKVHGEDLLPVTEAQAGDIVATTGLRCTSTGDTIVSVKSPLKEYRLRGVQVGHIPPFLFLTPAGTPACVYLRYWAQLDYRATKAQWCFAKLAVGRS